jgi:polygalacturonase
MFNSVSRHNSKPLVNRTMNLTRKDFLLRAGAAALPVSLAGAVIAAGADHAAAPTPTLPQFNVRQFGAQGDGQTKDTKAIQSAIDAAGVTGGTVYFPPGKYLSGTLRLRSHVTVFLDAGATLISSPDQDDFDPYEKLSFKSYSDDETTDFHYALLCGQDVEHVGVVGPGTIDGNRPKRHGPKPIALKCCRHVAVRDITIRNSPNYNISLLGCDHVNIEGVTILNGYCDGIDPDCCHHVRIANCYVEAWDDAIVPKASFALGYRRSTENVTITNCVLTTACNCFKLGTESSGDFKNITVSNCTMFARPDLWKNRYPTSGISLEMVDGASVERIAISNIVMVDIESPIFVRLGNRGRAQAVPTPEHLQGISISDIVATGAQRASSITGIPGFPVRRITLKNIRISAIGGGTAELARKDVPELEGKYPDADMFDDLPAYGLFCRHAETLVLDNVNLHLEKPDARPAMIFDRVEDLDLRAGSAASPSGNEPAIWLRDVRRCFMQGLRALAGTRTLFKLSGAQTDRILALGNDFSEATHVFEVEQGVAKRALRQEANCLRR